jgi:hypothetical protein
MENSYIEKRWLVIPASVVDQVDFNQVLEYSPETLRYSVDKLQTFVKYMVNVVPVTYTYTYVDAITGETKTVTVEAGVYCRPDIYNGVYPEYEYDEMIALLSTPEWTEPLPLGPTT